MKLTNKSLGWEYETSHTYTSVGSKNKEFNIFETISLKINELNEVYIKVIVVSNEDTRCSYENFEHISCFSVSSLWEDNDTWTPSRHNQHKCLQFILDFMKSGQWDDKTYPN